MAFTAGYASVRSQPLGARDFNRWWHALGRYRELEQGDEGRKRIAEAVRVQQALEADEQRLDGAFATTRDTTNDSATRTSAPRIYDPSDERHNASLFTNPSALLAILPPDDPRAIYVRRGGRLDAQGNPLTRGTPRTDARTQTIIVTDPTTGAEVRHEALRTPVAPPAPRQPASAPLTPPHPSAPAQDAQSAMTRSLLDLSPTLPLLSDD